VTFLQRKKEGGRGGEKRREGRRGGGGGREGRGGKRNRTLSLLVSRAWLPHPNRNHPLR